MNRCRCRRGAKVVRGHGGQGIGAQSEVARDGGARKVVGCRGKTAQQHGPVEKLDVRHAAVRITGGSFNCYGVGVAEFGVVHRIRDGHAWRHVGSTDRNVHNGGRG